MTFNIIYLAIGLLFLMLGTVAALTEFSGKTIGGFVRGKIPWRTVGETLLVLSTFGEGLSGFFLFGGEIPHWKNPSFAEVSSWAWGTKPEWLPLFMFLGPGVIGTLMLLQKFIPSWKDSCKNLMFVAAGVYAGLVFIIPAISWMIGTRTPTVPSGFYVNAGAASPRIPTKPGYAVQFSGARIETHCLYRDSRPEGIVGNPLTPCSNGPMFAVFARNIGADREYITWRYVLR